MNSKPKNNKTEKRKKAKLFSFRYFLFDFVKLTATLPTLIALRPRWHYENKEAHKKIRGAAMTVANHQSYLDPINMLLAIWYRRLHMVATEHLFASRLGNWFFRKMLCIPVDKENFNMQTFREVGKMCIRDRAKAVAKNPGADINPLYIYGASGLGKTHLLQSIANYLSLHKPGLRVLYTTCLLYTSRCV